MTPYSSTPTKSTITELYVDPTTLKARVQWSKGRSARRAALASAMRTVVTIPAALAVAGTYLIFSEVSYLYVPTIGYVMAKAGVNLSDVSYTRPRQSTCVFYPRPATACIVRRFENRRASRRTQKKRPRDQRGLFFLFQAKFPQACFCKPAERNPFSRRRADCRPKTCQSGDPPRSRS